MVQVSVTFEDEGGAQSKGIGIKLMDSLYQTGLSSKWCQRNHPSNGCFSNKSPGFVSHSEIKVVSAIRALVLSVTVKSSVKIEANFVSVGGGSTEVRRFHSSFHTAQSGLTLTKVQGILRTQSLGEDMTLTWKLFPRLVFRLLGCDGLLQKKAYKILSISLEVVMDSQSLWIFRFDIILHC
ncbi:hypothetical protein C5167_041619 [Papaver somniferum]|nr:hypothetical protein C5167_041619 [Papaver somniferum]